MSGSHFNSQDEDNATNLCQDPKFKGFDLQAGQSWVYPTNYSVRDYQFNIIQEALHKNTLVSLPTGLGKTFIAAVVMYNFYRWYPHDKIIFMAPTRPLVKQQMDACYNITAIPQEVTAELTGTKVQQSRKEIWHNKRVFFITPQVLQNDLAIIIEGGDKIKCLVFDEAHRAKGNHAYCEVIRKLLPNNKLFRVLALSATPGNSSRDVIEVMKNLLINHVEFRSEESEDVKPYVFERVLESVVVPLGEKLQQVKDKYIEILEKYTRTLIKYKVIYGNCSNLTKGRIFMVMKEFQSKNSGGNRCSNYGEIMKSLNICLTLYHAYETLIRCGLRAFQNFYEEHIKNPLLRGSVDLHIILEDLKQFLGPNADVQTLPDGTFTEVPASTKFGHPKFYKLRDILQTHFQNSEPSTRVIVFFEYRESVTEAFALLSQNYPQIRPRVFVGQGSGVTQKDQINTIKAFRDGNCNTLLSTCIGEEGLDVGDVDLIVCFDIANKSPIRMIQRMGRTGRKKEGRVVVLVTEGREQQTLKECLIYKNNMGHFISNSEQLNPGKYADNPKMIPSYIQPKCQKMYITVKKPAAPTKSGNLKDMLKKIAANGPKFSEDLEIIEINERITTKVENFWDKEHPLSVESETPKINYCRFLEKQRSLQVCGEVKHSKQTEMFVSLLQFADSKRFNLPTTQNLNKFVPQEKILKQGDIRSMFSKPLMNTLTQGPYLSSQHKFPAPDLESKSVPNEVFHELSTFLAINMSTKRTPELLFECPKFLTKDSEKIDLSSIVLPDLSILDNISSKDLDVFAESLTPKSKEIYHEFLEEDIEGFGDITFNESKIDSKYETPRDFDKILKSFRICDDDGVEEIQKVEEKSFGFQMPKGFDKVLNMLEDTNTQTMLPEKSNEDLNKMDINNVILDFFKLSSLSEIFDEKSKDLDETIIYTPKIAYPKSPQTTPDLFEESPDLFSSPEKSSNPSNSSSPILSSYERVQNIQVKKKLFNDSQELRKKPRLSNLNVQRKSFFETSGKRSVDVKDSPQKDLDTEDFCDLDSFMNVDEVENRNGKKEENDKLAKQEEKDDLDISALCDLSAFGLTGSSIKNGNKKEDTKGSNTKDKHTHKNSEVQNENKKHTNTKLNSTKHKKPLKEKNPEKDLDINDFCDIESFFNEKVPKEKAQATQLSELDDFCDLSFFMETPKKTFASCNSEQKSDNQNVSSSSKQAKSFVNLTDSDVESPTKTNKSQQDIQKEIPAQKLEADINSNEQITIDLTDSDLDLSPVKTKKVELNKTVSQLSITQMLSLVAKNDEPLSTSQKENPYTPKVKSQKSGTSRKGILQLKQKTDTPKSRQKTRNIGISKLSQNRIKSPKTSRPIHNISLNDSDDDFEKSPVFAKLKQPSQIKKKENGGQSATPSKKRKQLFSDYIEHEAEVAEDVSDDESSGEDCFEASFVADESDCFNSTFTQAKYMESVKSPVRGGTFKIPETFRNNISNVFSQEVINEDNTYLNDTFCVEDDAEVENQSHDVSELELLEKKLNEMRKAKKRKKSEEKAGSKRRRIIVLSDDSD